MCDISKAFDRVPKRVLWVADRRRGYPLATMRMSPLTYQWERRLVERSMIGPVVRPVAGIGPGSAFATFELALLLVEVVRKLATLPMQIRVSLHVDDLMMQVVADSAEEVTRCAVVAGAVAVGGSEQYCGIHFDSSKTHLVSNSRHAAEVVAAAMGLQHGPVVDVAKKLGVDYSLVPGGAKAEVGSGYWQEVGGWSGQDRPNKKHCQSHQKRWCQAVYYGVQPAAVFGADIVGCPARLPDSLRVAKLKAAGPYIPSALLDLQYAWLPPGFDPGSKVDAAPLMRFDKELLLVGDVTPTALRMGLFMRRWLLPTRLAGSFRAESYRQ